MMLVAGIAVLLLSCIGNAEFWVILMNRRHALRYRHHRLRRARSLHDAGVFLFPPFLFYYAGLRDGGLLRGGTFDDLPASLQGIISVTFLGLVPFFYGVIRWWLRKPPTRQIAYHSTIHDVLADAKTSGNQAAVTGDRPGLLAKLPLNQIYQLEVTQKKIRLKNGQHEPKSVGDRRTIRLAHFSDVHLIGCPGRKFHEFVTDQLCRLKPDAFICTGDILDRIELLDWATQSFTKLAGVAPCFFILGNHDWHLDHDHIRQQLANTGWQDLGEQSTVTDIAGVSVMLAGTEYPWIGRNPNVPSRADEDVRLLLSHSPDQRNYAAGNDFDIMLCGHNHGGQVVLPVIGPVYSPSIYGVKYAGGLFEHGDMLIHVSRGVGGKDTLRWNCRPEVTLLELEV
ncbi:MAG: metallophosphoesterase [Fuerstiella sp.]